MNTGRVSPYEASPYDDRPPASRSSSGMPAAGSDESRSFGEVRPLWDDAVDEHDVGGDGSEEETDAVATGPAWTALARGVALLLGTLLVVDLFAAGGLPASGPWWLDMRPLPEVISAGLLGLSAATLLAFAVRPNLPVPIRTLAMLCVCLLILIAFKNATIYYGLLKRGDLHAGPPVAFSLHVAACLGVILLALRSAGGPRGLWGSLLVLIGFNTALVTLPIAHVACCGPIDARRPASAAIVWGPRPFEQHPEARLDARVQAAVALHQSGLAGEVLLAGDPPGESLERLKKFAREGGIPEASIGVLPADDAATFAELRSRFPTEEDVTPTLLAVSDADHLPRVVLAARRAGVTLRPVPATGIDPPESTVFLREIVELWRCYFRR